MLMKIDKKMSVMFMVLAILCVGMAVVNAASVTGLGGTTMSSSVTWPWERFLGSLAEQLSGPLPRILGVLGIVGAAVALFAGNGGAGTQKFIMLIFAISIALFAPTFISWLSSSSGNSATVADVFDTVEHIGLYLQ